MLSVLVVESHHQEAKFLTESLTRQGYRVDSVDTGQGALDGYGRAEVVLLALELPDLDGLEVCRGIRTNSDVPVISLTAGTETDRVLSLKAGSDDCLVKPYGIRELLARIESVMRRARPASPVSKVISHGALHIDPRSRQVHVRGRAVDATRKEFDLLSLLASQPNTVVSRRELMAKVWEDDWAVSSRTIDTHVSMLRRKLGDGNWITTVRGVGYRLGHEPYGHES